ncbi:MAG: SCO family protein [Burkholderiales bacterium]|nr:SCO family protein [Burkholderiales bacterium]
MKRRHLLVLTTLLGATTLTGCDRVRGWLGQDAAGGAAGGFNAVDITGVDYAQGLALPDVDGKPRSLAEFKGKVVVVFFGYVHCPDVCPTTLAELAEIKRQLGTDGQRLQAVFVTLDPERDTAPMLKAYVQGFDPAFVALRGTPQQVADAAKSFKVFYQKVKGSTPDGYLVDHTAGSYVFDPQGRVRLFARYGMPVADLTADIRKLLAGG